MLLRFEYDKVIAFHPYRTSQPWDLGGIRVMQVDGVNINGPGRDEQVKFIADELHRLQVDLCDEINAYPGGKAYIDNHYGFTVVSEGTAGSPDLTYQLRFSDGSMTVWLMPDAWRVNLTGMKHDVPAIKAEAIQLLVENQGRDEEPTELLVERLTGVVEDLLMVAP